MASSEECPGFKISNLTPEERFSVYVKFGWQIFTITVQEIIQIALDKKVAKPKYSKNVGEGIDTTAQAAGIIAGLFIPVSAAVIKPVSKVVGVVLKTAVEETGGAVEKNQQHVSAMDMHKIIGSFDASNPKSYEPVISTFCEIFLHFNIQFIHLLDAKKLDCHLNKALYKLALDSVSKIFHGLKDSLEKNEELPNEFSKTFLIDCFLKGKSKGGFFDQIRNKLPKVLSGKSLGGKLKHSESKNNFSTQDLFEIPLVKAKDGKIYSSTSSVNTNKFFYRHLFAHEDLENHKNFVYGQVCDWLPTFDEKNDQFVEMSRSKERIIKELNKHMKNLVEKMDEDTNKLLAEINAVYDNIDAKFDQIKKQNDQNKDDILAQDNANTEKILAKLASLELKLESKTYTVALGNPGSGKSTVLNSLAGESFFKSGLSIGTGLTSQLDEGSNKNGVFLDTPGLADEKLRTASGKAIYQALKKDGHYQILFFVTERNGRVLQQDATTIKLILDTAPDIGEDYGIIVNMLSKGVMKKIKENRMFKEDFLNILFAGISAERRCPYNRVMFLGKLQELEDEDDVLVSSNIFIDEKGMTLAQFVNNVVPTVNIKKDNVNEVRLQDFDKVTRDLETVAKEMQLKDLAWKEERRLYEEERIKKATEDQIKCQELRKEIQKEKEELEALILKQEN